MVCFIVGIIGNVYLLNDEYLVYVVGMMNLMVIIQVVGCMFLIILIDLDFVSVFEFMQVCDGFLFIGGCLNVYFEEYGEVVIEVYGDFDCVCDVVVLELICVCVVVGQLILGICCGF